MYKNELVILEKPLPHYKEKKQKNESLYFYFFKEHSASLFLLIYISNSSFCHEFDEI